MALPITMALTVSSWVGLQAALRGSPYSGPRLRLLASLPLDLRSNSVRAFRQKLGTSLELEFGPSGFLVSARQGPGMGKPAGGKFRPEDRQAAVARAKEIIALLADILGIQADSALGVPFAQGTPASAQVYFEETHEGMKIAPGGTVTVDLGPSGELLALYSNYVRDVRTSNSRVLPRESAELSAISAVPTLASPSRPEGGGVLLWITPGQAPPGAGSEGISSGCWLVIGSSWS